MSDFVLTAENYFGTDADKRYMSVSQYKNFRGTYGFTGCEAQAMARINGVYEEEPSKALLVGSYVDAYFEGTVDSFKIDHPEIFTQKGELRSEFKQAEKMIKRAEKSELFMQYMSGDKQVIMTGNVGGADWKIKIDSYIPGKAIVDLKTAESLTKLFWIRDIGQFIDWVVYWGYDIQGAVYQEVVRQQTGEKLPFYIAGISKEKEPDIEVIKINQSVLDEALGNVERNLPYVLDVKNGEEEPHRCGACDYCRSTKVLTQPIWLSDLTVAV